VKELGAGGQQRAARELGWGRMTIRKGMRELDSGFLCLDAFALRGRKRAAAHLPNLLTDIHVLVDRQSPTDPQFCTNRLSTRLTAAEVRRQLLTHTGYPDAELPTAETMGAKLHIGIIHCAKLPTSYNMAVRPHAAPLVSASAHSDHERHAMRSDARHHKMRRHVFHLVTCGISLWEGIPDDTLLTEGITHRIRLLWRSHLAVDDAATSSMLEPS
jgi:hypothetical protein